MTVTKTLENIGKCRDLIETKDLKKILSKIGVFEQTTDCLKHHIDKYIKNEHYELDFTPYDLQELSDEIFNFIKDIQDHFTFDFGKNLILEHKKIDNKVFLEFSQRQSDEMFLDRKLREAYKILSYLGLTLYLFEESRK